MNDYSKISKIKDWFEDLYELVSCRYRDTIHTIRTPFIFLQNVWQFRKELWRFRGWDHEFNLRIFLRSLELTARHLEDGITVSGPQDARDIRKFIGMVNDSLHPHEAAERYTGKSFNDVFEAAHPNFPNEWMHPAPEGPREEWPQAQRDYEDMSALVQKIEQRSWKNAWRLYEKKGRGWWE